MNSPCLLADDLSGALEAGAAFRARGQRVTLALGGPGPDGGAGLSVFSSETRNAPPHEAAEKVRRLLAAQRAAGFQLVFKKIDSTLRGPVGAELKALLDELTPPRVVVCPATPAANRTVKDGRLLVAGVPVAETAFRFDPVWPITVSQVEVHLRAGGIESIGRLTLAALRDETGTLPAPHGGVIVCDAETDDDLRRLVARMRRAEPRTIFVGGGGLAHALATEISGNAALVSLERPRPRTTLFVSGSLHERSRRQLERLHELRQVPWHEIGRDAFSPPGIARKISTSLAEKGAAILTIGRESGTVSPREPIAWLAAVLTALIEQGGAPEMIVATGGETAQELRVAAGIQQLELCGEFETGVVLTAVSTAKATALRWMVIKPGGFGTDDVWLRLGNP